MYYNPEDFSRTIVALRAKLDSDEDYANRSSSVNPRSPRNDDDNNDSSAKEPEPRGVNNGNTTTANTSKQDNLVIDNTVPSPGAHIDIQKDSNMTTSTPLGVPRIQNLSTITVTSSRIERLSSSSSSVNSSDSSEPSENNPEQQVNLSTSGSSSSDSDLDDPVRENDSDYPDSDNIPESGIVPQSNDKAITDKVTTAEQSTVTEKGVVPSTTSTIDASTKSIAQDISIPSTSRSIDTTIANQTPAIPNKDNLAIVPYVKPIPSTTVLTPVPQSVSNLQFFIRQTCFNTKTFITDAEQAAAIENILYIPSQ